MPMTRRIEDCKLASLQVLPSTSLDDEETRDVEGWLYLDVNEDRFKCVGKSFPAGRVVETADACG